jgi:hypothetical protein
MTLAILEKATAALVARRQEELEIVAGEILSLVVGGDGDLIEPFVIVVEALPDAAARVEAYRDAIRNARSGSALEQQAVAGFAKHVEALPDAEARMKAYRVAADKAAIGSELERLVASEIRGLSRTTTKTWPEQKSPKRPEEIAAFVNRFRSPLQT